MRRTFADQLYKEMKKNDKIYLLTGDLGYKMWDQIQKDFPHRYINCGASEQAMMGIAVGLALEGKIPFVYSITPFLLYRPFEWIRNYLNHERIPVKLVGCGRDKDYLADGFTHWAEEELKVMNIFNKIICHYPSAKKDIKSILKIMIESNSPSFISLTR